MAAPMIVAGAGIAGMAACLALAKEDQPVLWIAPGLSDEAISSDKGRALKDKPGESLAAAAEPLLQSLGLGGCLDDPAHRRVEVTYSSWGGDALLERNRLGMTGRLGYVVHRGMLECNLARAVAHCRMVECLGGSVVAASREADLWRIRVALDQGGEEEVSGGFIIDATGRQAAVSRRFAAMKRQDTLIAAYDFLVQQDEDVEPTQATLIEAVAEGWWYGSLLADGRLALNFYSDPDLLPKGLRHRIEPWQALARRSRYVGRWIESAGFALSAPPSLTSAGTTWLEPTVGVGWAAVGDAAAAFDPLSAHGMTTALWTGIEAARAAAQAVDGSDAALATYGDRVQSGITRFLVSRGQVYGRERRFADQPFWRRRLLA
ncbi:glycine oxidase maturase GoxB [Lamprobacter modestohalophilus]|nr:glycine oxidase maturase GoxB [Lamprobacter modestohalophilus]